MVWPNYYYLILHIVLLFSKNKMPSYFVHRNFKACMQTVCFFLNVVVGFTWCLFIVKWRAPCKVAVAEGLPSFSIFSKS